MTEINRYHIFVNTALRSKSSDSTSNFSIQVNPPFVKSHPENYFTAQIVSVEIPYAWNQINSTNNKLPITYRGVNYTITISDGNYNVNSLLTELKDRIFKTIPSYNWQDNTLYLQNTSQLLFQIAGKDGVPTTMIYKFSQNAFLGKIFGCLTDKSFGYDSSNVSNIALSDTNVNVNPISSIYIRSSNLKQIKNQENLVSGYAQDPSDILCKLQVYTPPKTWIFYNGELGLSARLTNPIIDKLDIYLSDNSSFALDLKNNDWTFRITFVEYEPKQITDAYTKTKDLNGQISNLRAESNVSDPKSEAMLISDVSKERSDASKERNDVSKRFQR